MSRIDNLKFDDQISPSFSESSPVMQSDIGVTGGAWLEQALTLTLSAAAVERKWRLGARITVQAVGLSLNMIVEAHLVQKTAAGVMVATHDKAMVTNAAIALTQNTAFVTLTRTIPVPANSTDVFYIRLLVNQNAKILKDYTYFTATLVQ